jgi:hypothetical protein
MPGPPITSPQELLARLDASALRDIVARLIGVGPLASVVFHLHRPILGAQGYSGMTCILTVQYAADNGCTGWVDLLLKWSRWATAEGRWYPALMAAGAPIPALHGSLQLVDPPEAVSDEVLVLEYLPHIGHADEDRGALAETLGRFHALDPGAIPDLPKVTAQGAVAGWTEVWQRIPVHAGAGELGPAIAQFVATRADAWSRVLDNLPRLAAAADALPRGVIHRDVSFQNTGWRSDRRHLLLFDIPQMAVGILAEDTQALVPGGSPLDAGVAERYLATLRGHGGPSLTPDHLRSAIDTVRPMARLSSLWWATARSCDGRVDFTQDIEEGRRWYRNRLLSLLEEVVAGLGRPRHFTA